MVTFFTSIVNAAVGFSVGSIDFSSYVKDDIQEVDDFLFASIVVFKSFCLLYFAYFYLNFLRILG